MPCPAEELGVITPFEVLDDSSVNVDGTLCDAWRVVACSAFGHGMPCLY